MTKKAIALTILVGLGLGSAFAETVVLNPGYIQGVVQLGSLPISSGSVQADAGNGVFGSGTIQNGGAYQAVAPGGNDYKLTYYCNFPTSSIQVKVDEAVSVPIGETVTKNVSRQTGNVTGHKC